MTKSLDRQQAQILKICKTFSSRDLARRGRSSIHLVANGSLIQLWDFAGNYVYPAFQFAAHTNLRPMVAEVNKLLRAGYKPWGVTAWWLGLSPPANLPPYLLLDTSSEKHIWEMAVSISH